MALAPLRPAGRRCTLRFESFGFARGRRARADFTTPSWMRGASCTETTSRSPATLRTWTSWRS
eukprot:5512648-Alexandrium_andersonii.AAC.1